MESRYHRLIISNPFKYLSGTGTFIQEFCRFRIKVTSDNWFYTNEFDASVETDARNNFPWISNGGDDEEGTTDGSG